MKRLPLLLLILSAATLHAANEYPPNLRWSTLTTAHFYVHYHQGEDELAQRAAGIAERAHERLVPLMGWTPRERTHIVLTDHVDLSNGSANPVPNNRIEVYVTAPGADPSSAIEYYDDWLNLVITHEYTHILHLDQARGFGGAMRKVFGRIPLFGFPNVWSPLWMTEGLATLTESELTNAGRLKGTYLDMILRTAAVENRFATEAQASGIGPYWPRGGARYFYGAKFLSWLAHKRGMEKLTEYINEYSGNIVPFRVNATAKDVYGTSLDALWNEWAEEQQRAYRAEVTARGELSKSTRLTHLGYDTKYTLLSPDGTRLAVAHEGPFERPTIRVFDEVGRDRTVATHKINNAAALSWSADGKAIAYSDLEAYRSFAIVSDLYIWEVGGDARRITHGARLRDPSFTPEGSLIAVRNEAGRNSLVEVDAATGDMRTLYEPADDTQFSEPAVSHDGTRIAVAEWHGGQIDVVLYDRAGKRIANLTESLAHATNASPRWSRDDRTLWFSSDVTGIPNLYSVDANGGAIKRLTNVYGAALYPTSNDGLTFFYSGLSADGFDVSTVGAHEYAIAPLHTPPGNRSGRGGGSRSSAMESSASPPPAATSSGGTPTRRRSPTSRTRSSTPTTASIRPSRSSRCATPTTRIGSSPRRRCRIAGCSGRRTGRSGWSAIISRPTRPASSPPR